MVLLAKEGDEEAFAQLVSTYKRLIFWHIHQFASGVPVAEHDDLFQEALIGLLKAVRTYDERYSAFGTYASSCINHSVIDAARRYHRQQETKETVSLEDAGTDLSTSDSPETDVIARESSSVLYEKIFSGLSDYEKTVFELYLSDRSYADIANELGKSEKSIANAICRIRRKLTNLLT